MVKLFYTFLIVLLKKRYRSQNKNQYKLRIGIKLILINNLTLLECVTFKILSYHFSIFK